MDMSFAWTNSYPECLAGWAAQRKWCLGSRGIAWVCASLRGSLWIVDSKLKTKGKMLKIFNHQRKQHFLGPLSLKFAQVQVLPLFSYNILIIFLSVKWHFWYSKGLSCISWQQGRNLSCWRPLARLTLCPFVKLSISFCFQRKHTSFRGIHHFSLSDGSI